MSVIKKIKAGKLDFSRIANSSSGASNKDFYNSSSIEKESWGDESGEVSFVPMDNGTYLIEQDGIGMGFTDQQGYENATDTSNDVSSKKMDFNFDKVPIAVSVADAKAGNYIDPSKLLQNEWGKEDSIVEFVDYGNGYYLIVQDGVGMGFTNQDGYNYLNGVNIDADDNNENVSSVDDSSKNDSKKDDLVMPIENEINQPIKYFDNTEPIVDTNGEKIIRNHVSGLTAELEDKIRNHDGGKFLCSSGTDSVTLDYYDYDGILVEEGKYYIDVIDSKLMPNPYIVRQLIDMHIDPSLFDSIRKIGYKKDISNNDYYNEYLSNYINLTVKDDFEPLSVDFNNLSKQLSSKGSGDKFIYSFENKGIEVHKYENTFTLDYKKNGHRVIETYSDFDKPKLLNSRIFTKDGEKYNIYQNGKLISSELQKININSYISDIDKRDAYKLNEWYGTTNFQGKYQYAFVYHHANGDISFKVSNDDRTDSIYTYDKNGNLKEKKIEFNNNGSEKYPFNNINILYGAFDKEISISYAPNDLYEYDDLKYSITNSDGEELLVYPNGYLAVTIENKNTGLKQTINFFDSNSDNDNSQSVDSSHLDDDIDTSIEKVDDLKETVSKVRNTIVDDASLGLKKLTNSIEESFKSETIVNNNDGKKTVVDLNEALGRSFSQTKVNSYDGSNIKDILESRRKNVEENDKSEVRVDKIETNQKNANDLKEALDNSFSQTKVNSYGDSNIKDILESRENNVDKNNGNVSENKENTKTNSSIVIPSVNDISKFERTSGIRPTVSKDGSVVYNGIYDGMEAQICEYSDNTFTVGYKKDGNRIIERFIKNDDDYQISSVRLIDEDGELYNYYKDGVLISSELQTIQNLNSIVYQNTKKNIDQFGGEWTADGDYRGHKASIRGYRDGSYTIDYKDGSNRIIYTYDSNNKIKNKRVIDGEDEKYFEYDGFGNIVNGLDQIDIVLTDVDKSKVSDEVEVDKSVKTEIKPSNVLSFGIMSPTNVPSFDQLVQNFDGSNLDYINEQKKKGLRYSVDVHEYDGEIDWNKVKKSGIDYAIVRCSVTYWGSDHDEIALDIDKRARENVMNAIDAGIDVSIYTYSAAKNEQEAKIEAEKVIEFLESLPEEYRNKIKGPIVYDYETFDYKEESGNTYATRCLGMTPKERTSVINAFNKYIQDNGYKTMTYTNRSAFENEIDGKGLLDENNLAWIAEFGNDIKYDGNYNMWQYSETGKVNGIPSSNIDLNVFYVDDSMENVPIEDNDIAKIEFEQSQNYKNEILSISHMEKLMNATSGTVAGESNGNTHVDLEGTKFVDLQGFDQYVTDNVSKVGYGTRDGVVSAMLSMNDYTLETGKRIRYQLRSGNNSSQDPRDSVLRNADDLCFDCSGIVGYCITKGGYNPPSDFGIVQTDYIYNWARNNNYVEDIHNGKPGDLLVTRGKGHVQMIVGAYDNGYYIAEETLVTEDNGASRNGLSISKQSFDSSDADYVLVNMDDFYNNKDNIR